MFLLVVRKWRRKHFFETLSSENIYRDVKCSFSNLPKKACLNAEFVSSHSPEKNWNRREIFKEHFSSKCSHGHVEYTLDNSVEKKLIRSQSFFAQSAKKLKKKILRLFFKKFFRSNYSCKHAECSFGSPAAFFDKRAKTFCSMSGDN